MVYRKINIKDRKGIYIILDLKNFQTADLRKLDQLLSNQISAVQLWDNLQDYESQYDIIDKILDVVQQHRIPILMNNRVDLVTKFDFDGVHFDEIPVDWDKIKDQLLGKLIGITCTNDKTIVEWAQQQKADYVSFCSMYPSANNTRCELVDKKLIVEFQQTLDIPFFLAGGITPDNVTELFSISYQGVALVSGLMRHDKPKELLENYYVKMNLNNEKNNY